LMLMAETLVPVVGTAVLILFALVTKPLYKSSSGSA
jgi:hypothetical protein